MLVGIRHPAITRFLLTRLGLQSGFIVSRQIHTERVRLGLFLSRFYFIHFILIIYLFFILIKLGLRTDTEIIFLGRLRSFRSNVVGFLVKNHNKSVAKNTSKICNKYFKSFMNRIIVIVSSYRKICKFRNNNITKMLLSHWLNYSNEMNYIFLIPFYM